MPAKSAKQAKFLEKFSKGVKSVTAKARSGAALPSKVLISVGGKPTKEKSK